ncbi:hypothetical protein C3E79_03450 [Corynebacterium liangguodongii]|uniref:Uncharacterized protein n=1 Tax=Corynebacterium liangguodongii TaxID=2079535 RepID=A0A2S0WD04_9CORY|nr:hypothetical protein C3E79_03450 [Corynebacterium liangguodongii]PWB99534.1 hypothetical protein DF219_06345 [Corynebacterium liangguodongii]
MLRTFFPSAAVPLAVIALGVVAVCLAAVLLSGAEPAYIPAAIGETWLAIHGVPVTIDGVTMGLTPLIGPVAIAALVARRSRAALGARPQMREVGAYAALTAGVALTLTGIAVFMVADASHVYPVALPHPLALLLPIGPYAAGIVFGAFSVPGSREALNLLVRLGAAAAVVFAALCVAGWPKMAQLGESFPAPALVALSLVYALNGIAATLGVLLGGSLEYASQAASLFVVDNVALPPLPLFAAVPAQAPAWAPALMVIPTAVIAHFFATRGTGPQRIKRIKEALLTSAWTGALVLAAVPYTGGVVGAYDYIGPHPLIVPLLALAWVGIIGLIVAAVPRKAHRAGSDALDSGE